MYDGLRRLRVHGRRRVLVEMLGPRPSQRAGHREEPLTARVVDAGEDVVGLPVGQLVLVGLYAGTLIRDGGRELLALHDEDVLVTVHPEEA